MMDTSKVTTPPATPSRASIDPATNAERSTVSMYPPTMDNSDDFIEIRHVPDLVDVTPPQMLMQTPITIECGPDLATKLIFHQEIICCNSKQLSNRFEKAKPLMAHYKKADDFRNDLARYVFPEVDPKEFEDKKMDRQAIPLIKEASENYPLIGYAGLVKKNIMDAVAGEMIAKNNMKKLAPKPGVELSLAGRLDLLKPQSVHAVAAKLFTFVHRINKAEISKAKDDILKATAQHRIILPSVDESTVRALMQWIYHKTLPFEGSEQTYAVMNLAERLGVDALADKCRGALHYATFGCLKTAETDGISLQTLLGYGMNPANDDVVKVVFQYAMKDVSAPMELKSLIIDSLAGYLDLELWQHVKDQINHKTALQIIESMISLRPLVKTEMDSPDSIKSESQEASSSNVSESMAIDEDKKPIHVKEQNENHI